MWRCENVGRQKNSHKGTGDPWTDLWAAIIRRAILDAGRGDWRAAVWLWTVEPAIAELAADRMLAQPETQITE